MTQPQHSTQPAAGPSAKNIVDIPPLTMPMCTRVWSKALFADSKLKITPGEPLLWQFNQPHPYVGTYKIVRMYVVAGGAVEVFSSDAESGAPDAGKTGLRHVIPWHEVLLIEEAMDAKTFVEEMEDAEAGDEDEDDDEDGDEGDDPKPLTSDSNGSAPLVPLTSGGGEG